MMTVITFSIMTNKLAAIHKLNRDNPLGEEYHHDGDTKIEESSKPT